MQKSKAQGKSKKLGTETFEFLIAFLSFDF